MVEAAGTAATDAEVVGAIDVVEAVAAAVPVQAVEVVGWSRRPEWSRRWGVFLHDSGEPRPRIGSTDAPSRASILAMTDHVAAHHGTQHVHVGQSSWKSCSSIAALRFDEHEDSSTKSDVCSMFEPWDRWQHTLADVIVLSRRRMAWKPRVSELPLRSVRGSSGIAQPWP